MSYDLAIDLGTTGCRSILFDEKLNTIGQAYEEYGLITTKENWVEQDAELWWELTLHTMQKVIESISVDAKKIMGISVSSQGITLIPVDKDLKPLCNALSWLDVRAEKETEIVRKDYNRDAFFELTGKEIKSVYTLPKLLWLKENRADIFKKAYKFLLPMDFLIARLTGEILTDHSMACGTLLYDLKNACWAESICSHYGISIEKLPRLAWSGEVAGTLRKEIAERLGLSSNCIVAVGAQDQKCAAFGVGLAEDKLSISLGTAAAVTNLWTNLEGIRKKQVSWCAYVQPKFWVTEGVIETAGTCLRYVRDLFYKGESFGGIDTEVAECLKNKTDILFYPYLNRDIKGNTEGATGCFYGISLSAKRGEYATAVMEGVAFQLRALLEDMHAYDAQKNVVMFGGGAKASIWCQIIADVIGLKVFVPETEEAAGAGAARFAAMACNKEIAPLESIKCFNPSKEQEDYYSNKYQRYRKMAAKMWGTRE